MPCEGNSLRSVNVPTCISLLYRNPDKMRVWRDKEGAKVPQGSAQRANRSIGYVINIDLYRLNRTDSKGAQRSPTETGIHQLAAAIAIDSGPLTKIRVASPRSTL